MPALYFILDNKCISKSGKIMKKNFKHFSFKQNHIKDTTRYINFKQKCNFYLCFKQTIKNFDLYANFKDKEFSSVE